MRTVNTRVLIVGGAVLALVVGWALILHNQHDYAQEAIARYGGKEKLLRNVENPAGKTPQKAAAQRRLAEELRAADAEKK